MKFPILALLAAAPAHGYELKQQLEGHFGAALPPLNTGQIYTALSRLERDGFVEADEVAEGTRNKLVLAGRTGMAEPKVLIERQRVEYLQALRDLDRMLDRANGDAAAALLIEGAALHLDADLKWLALCEQRLTEEVIDGQRAAD
jgi:DNA-binding PadR family transcriptional regulator